MSRTFRGRITRRLSVMVVASMVLWTLMPGIALAHNDDDNENKDRRGNHGDNDGRGHDDDHESDVDFRARLSPGEEVPPTDSDGEGRVTFRVEGSTVSFKLRWEDLTTGTTAGHIHCGAKGALGPVGVDLLHEPMGTDGRVRDSFTGPNPGNACGWLDLGDVLSAMLTGNAYVNVHTATFPSGEIRGQVEVGKLKFEAELSPGEEVPPTDSDGEGEATFRVEGSTVSFKLKWEDLTTGTTAGHIHCGAKGALGPVGVDLLHEPMGTDGRVRDSFTGPNPGNQCGWVNLGDVLSAMLTGNAYVNVHTATFPSGEIRGQVETD